VHKKLLLQAAACNLALLLRKVIGVRTPRAPGRGGTSNFGFIAPYLGYQSSFRISALVIGCYLAPDVASGPMHSTGSCGLIRPV
jgi:hypothetical protein